LVIGALPLSQSPNRGHFGALGSYPTICSAASRRVQNMNRALEFYTEGVPLGKARLGRIGLDEWLRRSQARA
jgi:hypothetical protein